MNRIILHQIWNRRRRNIWIFLELLLTGYFLWMVLDPICVLTADRMIPRGYDPKGIYRLTLGYYDEGYGRYYQADEDNNEAKARQLQLIMNELASCPEISSVAFGSESCFPNCGSWSGSLMQDEDTNKVSMQIYTYFDVPHNDPAGVLGLTDALSGEKLRLPSDFFHSGNQVAISEQLALELFGTAQVVGKKVHCNGGELEVVGVFHDIKHFDVRQPFPLALMSQPLGYIHLYQSVLFRMKEGADEQAFRQRFERDIVPKINRGNFYYVGLKSFSDYSRDMAFRTGITSKLRMHYVLAGFALLCIFLGVFGTFWMHARDRCSELGVLRSLGASKGTIMGNFYFEIWSVVTVAFVLVLFVLFHYVRSEGLGPVIQMSQGSVGIPDPIYWQNRLWTRFFVVSVITYILLLAVSFIAVYFPVRRMLSLPPADALRDE